MTSNERLTRIIDLLTEVRQLVAPIPAGYTKKTLAIILGAMKSMKEAQYNVEGDDPPDS